ncbi:MAG TPA: MFS transporter [Ignavibacteria bacterium]
MISESRFKIFIIIITTLASFMTAFMGSAINIALPLIGNEFSSGAVLLSWFATSYLLTTAVLLIPIGKLSDIIGRAKFMKIGIIIFSIGSLLCGLSNSGTMLLILRLFQGVGSAMIFTTSTAILVSVFPLNERGKVIGINITSVYTGLSTGPFLGGIISHNFGWRFIFYFNFLLGIIIVVLILFYLKVEWIEAKEEKFDITGSVIYIFSLTALMLGLTFLPGITGIALVSTGITSLYLFYNYEKRKEHPVFNVIVFKTNKTFTFSNIAALINYSATFAISFIMSLYLQKVKGLNPQDAGLILVTQPVLMAIFSPLAGKLSDKIEPRKVASIGMGILTAGLITFSFINLSFSYILIIINLAIIGFGFALFSSPNTNAVMSSVEKKYYGVASSTLSSMRMVGQMFSMGIVIVIFSIFIGKAEITSENQNDFIYSIRLAFALFSMLCFLGIFASLRRGKIHN